ncbi:HD domain-containing protein [Candidatus Woesearchaeota archaeon]|nr:HD domain-containing protein [Candidatus Woesearchaeota archaeon]
MDVGDKLYGTVLVSEPVLVELLNCNAVQRLRGVNQNGLPAEFSKFPSFSRFEHSVGVMLLLKQLGASVEEQIAGLCHDVSHPAFSHVIDWVFGLGTHGLEDLQDDNHSWFVSKTEIPSILQKHGFSVSIVNNFKQFSLLEKSIPDVCADRVDYALREMMLWANSSAVNHCLGSLCVVDNCIVFSSKSAALDFSRAFLKMQVENWGSADSMLKYLCFAKVLQLALQRGYISMQDLYTVDDVVLQKLAVCNDEAVLKELSAMRNGVALSNGSIHLVKKFRYVDPLFYDNGVLVRLSCAVPSFAGEIEVARKKNREGISALA